MTSQHNAELPAYFKGLNPEQMEAASHAHGPMLVLAGAGSGKTRVLTVRVANLIHRHGVRPSQIMAVTFTNKAAGEMRERVSHLVGGDLQGMYIGTFHAFGSRVLRRYAEKLGWKPRFTIYDQDDSEREVSRRMKALDYDPDRFDPAGVLKAISDAKNALQDPMSYRTQAELSGNPWEEMVGRVYESYEMGLRSNNAFDFDDLLVKPVEIFRRFPEIREEYQARFSHLLIDEYQDTNHVQYRLIRMLSEKHQNVFVVGDDDQAIYAWRGADIRNILEFEKDYPNARTVRLEQNYRSTGVILGAANEVIANNTQRKGKTLRTDKSGGELITLAACERDLEESKYIAEEIDKIRDESREKDYRDFALLYRTNSQARVLEMELRSRNIPYKVVGATSFFGRREIKDMMSYLRLVANPMDSGACERVVNVPKRGVGKKSQDLLREFASSRGISMIDAAGEAEMISGMPKAAAGALVSFSRTVKKYADLVPTSAAAPLLEGLVKDLNFLELLRAEGPEGEDRANNVLELIAGAADFDQRQREAGTGEGLELYAEELALMSDPDTIDTEGNTVTLMTVHAAKGLEFPVVFLCGLEEGLFPSARALGEPAGIEEERRLMYVGLTRARQRLYLTYAKQRRRGSDFQYAPPSQFLQEIPSDLVEQVRFGGHTYKAFGGGGRGWSGRDWVDGGGARRPVAPQFPVQQEMEDFGEYDPYDQDIPSFVRNEEVEHPDYGGGRISQVSGFGRDLYVTVDFDSGEKMRLLARRSGLRRGF